MNDDRRKQLAVWVAKSILPHEARVRAWLNKRVAPDEADEIIQEAYCRLAMLDDVGAIDRPDAYFFSVARNLMLRRLKRRQIVPIEVVAEIESYCDERPSPEREAIAKADWARVSQLIAALPERCRHIVHLRKIEGWSQKQIAEHLGKTEKAVEKQIWLGVKAIRQGWSGLELAEFEVARGAQKKRARP